MPIDVALLRWEDTNKEVEQWQRDRRHDSSSSSSPNYVALTRTADEEYRDIKKQLGLARHDYKKQKQKQKQPTKASSVMMELEQLAKQKYNELQHVLLPKLGNMIDDNNNDTTLQETIQQIQQDCRQKLKDEYFHNNDDSFKFYHAFCKDDEIMIRKNPLYSIGGCELMVVTTDHHRRKQATKMVLTQLGKELNHSLEDYRNRMIPSNQSIHVPRYTQVSKHMAHAMRGCRQDDDDNDDLVQVPSWMSFIGTQPQWKKLSDSQLPYICTFPYYTNEYDREYGHELEQYHICAFTSPTLVESRSMQEKLVVQMVTYFSSLLLLLDDNNHQNKDTIVRIRHLSKKELGLSEAKHVVIEGYMPSKRQYIPLGYVSNTTDYITRVHSLSFIGGGQKQQDRSYVHLVHAKLAPSTITLSWLFEHNIASITSPPNGSQTEKLTQRSSIGILLLPPCLTKISTTVDNKDDDIIKGGNSLLFLPFQRFWKHGKKKGKVIFQQIHPPPLPHYWKKKNNDHYYHHPSNDKMIDISNTNVNDTHTTGTPKFPPLFHIPLHKERDKWIIQGEALCSPYDFLPFFHT